MTGKTHTYAVALTWTGNQGTGTSSYTAFSRDHVISSGNKPEIPCSSDPAFRGDDTRWNPEDFLVASLSACHQLWYLHLCGANGIAVLAYKDNATGMMQENPDHSGQFSEVVLRPRVTIRAGDDGELAHRLHEQAARMCFIARSVAFPVRHEPQIVHEAQNDQEGDGA